MATTVHVLTDQVSPLRVTQQHYVAKSKHCEGRGGCTRYLAQRYLSAWDLHVMSGKGPALMKPGKLRHLHPLPACQPGLLPRPLDLTASEQRNLGNPLPTVIHLLHLCACIKSDLRNMSMWYEMEDVYEQPQQLCGERHYSAYVSTVQRPPNTHTTRAHIFFFFFLSFLFFLPRLFS